MYNNNNNNFIEAFKIDEATSSGPGSNIKGLTLNLCTDFLLASFNFLSA
jgi:hypothetical protein